MPTKKNKRIVAVSGGFDPVHIGHIRMFKKARSLGDHLVVILNNDHWLHTKKGYAFMPQQQRAEVLKSIRWVDEVVITKHKKGDPDTSVCKALKALRPHIFANGGDRKNDTTPEVQLCRELGITLVFNTGGGKANSSSILVKEAAKKIAKKK